MSISALLLFTYVIYIKILCFTCFFVVWGSKWRRSFTWHTAARNWYRRCNSEQHGIPGAVHSLRVYGIYCEHFWYHHDSRQFRCHPWLMWSNIRHSSDVPRPMSVLRQQRYKRNRISDVTANGTETKTTDLSPSLPYIIHRKHKVYSWQLYVYWLPVYIQSQIPPYNSSITTPTIPWRDIPKRSWTDGNPRHCHSAVIKNQSSGRYEHKSLFIQGINETQECVMTQLPRKLWVQWHIT